MIFLVHEKARHVVKVYQDSEELPSGVNLCKTFWKLAEKFPEETLLWVEKNQYSALRKENLEEIFVHDLLMCSYAVKTKFLPGRIGYIDQLPFINVKRGVKYPTWRMSSDVGGMKGRTLLKFKEIFREITDFDYLLNSVAKVGQQNGVFCYSEPALCASGPENDISPIAGDRELLSFVHQHYKTVWTMVLFFCLVKYEKRFPLISFLQSLLKPKFFKKDIDLSDVYIKAGGSNKKSKTSIDVIIPTIGRAEYVTQVVEDLAEQTLLPAKVILVEQQPEQHAGSELQDLLARKWSFEIVHIFTHKTGACMARNRALEKVTAEWIFFADDDIRLEKEVLTKTIEEADRLGISCINLNCIQPGEETIFHKIKQWGSFGSGTSFVRSEFAKGLWFSEVFEHGYGEDADFGMKLREAGCDIIYDPNLQTRHLKAPIGGFRKKPVLVWEKETPKPKPSPTLMLFAKKYYTPRQLKGFKISLFLKYFRRQEIRNPFRYLKRMQKSWKRSEKWAKRLEGETQHSTKQSEKARQK